MRHSVFSVVSSVITPAVLLAFFFSGFSLSALAQHSSSGGGGAASSGGSHGGSSGGGGSVSHSSGGSTHGSSSHASASGSHAIGRNSAHGGLHIETSQHEKKGFFSALRHPFRKAEPKEVVELRRRICPNGRCQVCPAGSANGGWGCGRAANNVCSSREVWGGNACLLQTNFLDDCLAERAALDRQATRMRDAESARQAACATGSAADCAASGAAAQSEAGLYQSLQERYQQCRNRSWLGPSLGSNLSSDPRLSRGLLDGIFYIP